MHGIKQIKRDNIWKDAKGKARVCRDGFMQVRGNELAFLVPAALVTRSETD